MSKPGFVFLAGFFFFAAADVSLLVADPAPAARIEAILGSAQARDSNGQNQRKVKAGDFIGSGDTIETSQNAVLRLRFEDGMVIETAGPSRLEVEKFSYDSQTGKGEAKIRTGEGIFRFVTGRAAKENPEEFEVQLPTAIIGVRGTSILSEATREGSLIVKEGPGETGGGDHTVLARNVVKGTLRETPITENGTGSFVRRGEAPGPAVPVPEDVLRRLEEALEIKKPEDSDADFGDNLGVDEAGKGGEEVGRDVHALGDSQRQAGSDSQSQESSSQSQLY